MQATYEQQAEGIQSGYTEPGGPLPGSEPLEHPQGPYRPDYDRTLSVSLLRSRNNLNRFQAYDLTLLVCAINWMEKRFPGEDAGNFHGIYPEGRRIDGWLKHIPEWATARTARESKDLAERLGLIKTARTSFGDRSGTYLLYAVNWAQVAKVCFDAGAAPPKWIAKRLEELPPDPADEPGQIPLGMREVRDPPVQEQPHPEAEAADGSLYEPFVARVRELMPQVEYPGIYKNAIESVSVQRGLPIHPAWADYLKAFNDEVRERDGYAGGGIAVWRFKEELQGREDLSEPPSQEEPEETAPVAAYEKFDGERNQKAEIYWDDALGQLALQVTRPNYETWLKNTRGLGWDGTTFTVGAPNGFVAEMLEQRMYSLISRCLAKSIQEECEIAFAVYGDEDRRRDGQ